MSRSPREEADHDLSRCALMRHPPTRQAIGMILVSREWTRDASLIRRAFARIKKNRFPCWIVSYLEGTRVTPAKVERVGPGRARW